MKKYYHVTVLSNWLLGFNKYTLQYSKKNIPQSSYPNVFFVLPYDQLAIGLEKARQFKTEQAIPHNQLLVIETLLTDKEVLANTITPTHLGYYVERPWIKVSTLFSYQKESLIPLRIEEAMASSYQLNGVDQNRYQLLTPRSISLLPIAKGCQARCAFCFSSSSISKEQEQTTLSTQRINAVLQQAKQAGAIRAVITGGGEPGIMPASRLLAMLAQCKQVFDEVVMISNGYFLLKQPNLLQRLIEAGLSELSISRHHYAQDVNAVLMGLSIDSEKIADWSHQLTVEFPDFFMRWVCVLQQGGIDSEQALIRYIEWAFEHHVTQICFKELYVSSSSESPYFDEKSNEWSYQHQVSLSLITDYATRQDWKVINTLPWGVPVYEVIKGKQRLTIAAYTEPSVSWELRQGECRSWNLLADGRCYASLETLDSEIIINA
jgi:pyruvate-formate lyase-activating enzyme